MPGEVVYRHKRLVCSKRKSFCKVHAYEQCPDQDLDMPLLQCRLSQKVSHRHHAVLFLRPIKYSHSAGGKQSPVRRRHIVCVRLLEKQPHLRGSRCGLLLLLAAVSSQELSIPKISIVVFTPCFCCWIRHSMDTVRQCAVPDGSPVCTAPPKISIPAVSSGYRPYLPEAAL